MKRKTLRIAVAVLLGILVVGCVAFFTLRGTTYKIHIEKEQIQEAIDKKLPYTKKFGGIFVMKVKNTKVFLTDGSDRIGASTDLELNVKINKNPKNLGGYLKSETGVRYDQEKFCFYLLDPEVQELNAQGVPDKYTKVVSTYTKKVLRRHLTDVPVYKIKDKNLKLKLAKAVLQNVEVVNGSLVVTLGY